MKKLALTAMVAAVALGSTAAMAADLPRKAAALPPPPPPSPWDVAFGGAIMSDYNFRGISQSNRGPSVGAYFEPQYKSAVGTFYVGLAGVAIDWPLLDGVNLTPAGFPDYGLTAPSAEIDIYGGWRNSWGPVSLDLGVWYYWYPKETWNGFTNNSDFVEFYAKLGYDFGNGVTIGGNVFYTPDLLNYGKTFSSISVLTTGFATSDVDAVYASFTGKWVLPWTTGDLGSFISGEVGHWWIDDGNWVATNLATGSTFTNPSYTYWNIGLAFTYKAFTLDLRYHGTDLSESECAGYLVVTDPTNKVSKWCNDTFIASIKFDTTLTALK